MKKGNWEDRANICWLFYLEVILNVPSVVKALKTILTPGKPLRFNRELNCLGLRAHTGAGSGPQGVGAGMRGQVYT